MLNKRDYIRNRPLPLDNRVRMKSFLFQKLKKNKAFWSYDISENNDCIDELIIEKTLIHLDYTDYQYLFNIYPKSKIKKVWLDNMVVQGNYYYSLNYFIAWFCFGIKNPKRFLKRFEKQLLN